MQPFRPPPAPGAPPYSAGVTPSPLYTPGTVTAANPALMAMRGPPPRGPPPIFAPGRSPPPASMGMGVPVGLIARPPPSIMPPVGLGPPRPLLQPPGMMHRLAPQTALPETGPLNVFVGKLPTDLNDSHVRNLLESCGHVVSWKRTADPLTNKPKAFGYCTYSSALDVLRALRLLNGFSMDSKQILVKVDTKTQAKLDEFTAAMPEATKAEEQARDEEVQRALKGLEDERSGLKGGIQNDPATWGDLLGVQTGDNTSDAADGEKPGDQNGDEVAEAAPVETKVQQKMILTEIEKFRLAQEQREREQEQKRREALRERLRREELEEEKRKAQDEVPVVETEPPIAVEETPAKEEATLESQEPVSERKSERKQSNADSEKSTKRHSDDDERETKKSRTRDRDREKDRDRRGRDRKHDRERDRSRERDRRKRARSHSRSRSRERSSRRRRRSSRTHSRSRSRSRSRDRERHRDRDRDRDRDHDRRRRRRHSPAADEEMDDGHRSKRRRGSRDSKDDANTKERSPRVNAAPPMKVVMELKMPLFAAKKEKPIPQPTASLFQLEEETEAKPVRELIRIDFDAEEKQATALAQERAAAAATKISSRNEDVKTLINRIPTDKTELFAYPIDWTAVDKHGIVKTKMEPWVTKKVLEYLGEEDTTMIQFILTKLSAHAKPDVILDELQLILEDEAEVFVKLLWRKLGFEALRAGA